MFLTAEENQKLAQVGPGTPGGEFLRRYWHAIGGLHEVPPESPTKLVRLLGEDLVLFRDKSGRVGLLADHCSHRGASLCYGRVEERGIACAYHGWLYDVEGNCLETPAEPADSHFHLTVKHRAYPVQKLFGLFWAYLGPLPVPPIRRLDVMAYPLLQIMEMPFDVNWVQVVENNIDGAHINILHQDTAQKKKQVASTTRGLADELLSLEYAEVDFGIMRKMVTSDGYTQEDPLVFPNMLRRMTELSIKVPVDDTHTRKFVLWVELSRNGHTSTNEEPVDYYLMPPGEGKTPGQARYPDATYRMDKLRYQDLMAIETQGAISPRDSWHLGTSDKGVAFFERMVLREMDAVQQGRDPVGVIRDPDRVIDTNFDLLHHIGDEASGPQGIHVYRRPQAAGVS